MGLTFLLPCSLLLIAGVLVQRYWHLRFVPGPWLTSYTDLWRVYKQRRPNYTNTLRKLHKCYGPVVRIGPNTVSVSSGLAVSQIYTMHGEFCKADSYSALRSVSNGIVRGTVIDMQDERQNTALKRAVGGIFSTKGALEFEPDIDNAIAQLLKTLASSKRISLLEVLLRFQIDFLMKAAFSEDAHFMEQQKETANWSFRTRYQHWVRWQGSPGLEWLIYKSKIAQMLRKARMPMWVALAAAQLRLHRTAQTKNAREDILSKYITAQEHHSDIFSDEVLLRMISSTISAGFDTTAFTMTTMLFYMMKKSIIEKRLREEISQANAAGNLSEPPQWNEVNKLTYLDAVMREAMRCYPFLQIPLERRVPTEGAKIAGICLPGGTTVGCHARVVHHDPQCFGPNVDTFDPARWTEANESDRRMMEAASLGFGSGKRICIGRHLAEIEVKKTVVAILLKHKLSLLEANMQLESADGLTSFPKPIMVSLYEL